MADQEQRPQKSGGPSSYRPILPRQSSEQVIDSATGTRLDETLPQGVPQLAPIGSAGDAQPSSTKKGYRQQVACTSRLPLSSLAENMIP